MRTYTYVQHRYHHYKLSVRNVCYLTHNCRFRSGHYSTKFIAEEYPEPHGFKGVTLSEDENLRMVAVAAAIHQVRSAPDEIRRTVTPPEVVDVDVLVSEGIVEIERDRSTS